MARSARSAGTSCRLARAKENICGNAAAPRDSSSAPMTSRPAKCGVTPIRAYAAVPAAMVASTMGLRLGSRSDQRASSVATATALMAFTVRKMPSCSGLRPACFTAYSAMNGMASDSPKPSAKQLRASGRACGRRSMAPRPLPWVGGAVVVMRSVRTWGSL
ncbi:hypothetical protein GCM10010842_02530 [Deinococcus daejeonensis]|uniref:Uncharacterized protein n=1 Tax=Deinococcus daejeonensis TaxID=1007098 RepID=A0ABQ2IRX7_9DEIO|nr:hypothetical protein GCM10010842_02530 [Deinococcus daejeonensis]